MGLIDGGVSVLHSLWTGVTGLRAFGASLDITADNISNINTYGFKGRKLEFAAIFADTQALYTSVGPSQEGEGIRIADIRTDFTQGAFETTTNPLDLAIDGNGFFVVKENPDAPELYTRAGNFNIGKDENGREGVIVNPEGLQLQVSQNGQIGSLDVSAATLRRRFGEDFKLESIAVNEAGVMTASGVDSRVVELGTLQRAKFMDPEALLPLGNGLYTQSYRSGLPLPPDVPTGGVVHQYALELSNVDLSTQFVNMIEYQRAFQINNRIVGTSDEILQQLIRIA